MRAQVRPLSALLVEAGVLLAGDGGGSGGGERRLREAA